MFNKPDEILRDEPGEAPEETPKKSSSIKLVKSIWLFIINGNCLIKSGTEYRLIPAEDWPRNVNFSISASAFNALKKPHKFKHEIVSNELFWQAGIVSPNNVAKNQVQQALHMGGHNNLNLDQVIEFLKVS